MPNSSKFDKNNIPQGPQCQYFVVRKKRLCRMTVRPGRQYCGEHEPEPRTNDEKDDKRIPCPYDAKHTCFASKLEKHLTICNAREQDAPEYIVHNINTGTDTGESQRKPLSEIPVDNILSVIHKVDDLFDKYLTDEIVTIPELPIHEAVLEDFNEEGRSESSLRHFRQASSLLHLIENEGLVQPNTCYVELGAGKGQLAVFMWRAWGPDCSVVLVERASLRHKRDRRATVTRLRADLAHLALGGLSEARQASALLGVAKHLCGAATDLSLRCMCAPDALDKVSGVVVATCCHHRCERAHYVGLPHLQKNGIDGEDFNVMLGIVSWATCGDGYSRERRRRSPDPRPLARLDLGRQRREEVGRRAKALLDWGRALFLRERGLDARLVRYVSSAVSPENVCIVATKRR